MYFKISTDLLNHIVWLLVVLILNHLAGGQVGVSRDPLSRDPLSAQVSDRCIAAVMFLSFCAIVWLNVGFLAPAANSSLPG